MEACFRSVAVSDRQKLSVGNQSEAAVQPAPTFLSRLHRQQSSVCCRSARIFVRQVPVSSCDSCNAKSRQLSIRNCPHYSLYEFTNLGKPPVRSTWVHLRCKLHVFGIDPSRRDCIIRSYTIYPQPPWK